MGREAAGERDKPRKMLRPTQRQALCKTTCLGNSESKGALSVFHTPYAQYC